MRQTELMVRVMQMQAGQCLKISSESMREAASGSLKSVFDGPVRRSDVDEFVKQISENWRVDVTELMDRDGWILRKLEAVDQRNQSTHHLTPATFHPAPRSR